jgi:DNA-binding MarR family transcriptional regulator
MNQAKPILNLQEFIPYRLTRAAEDVGHRFARVYRERYGIDRPEWRTLALIGQFTRITATEIAAQTGMHKTKVSRAVWALEERNWLVRKVDGSDRRVEQLELTSEGKAVYAELVSVARGFEDTFNGLMGSDALNALVHALNVIERLDPAE